MEFIKEYPLAKLQPADYNPRKITPEAFEKLKESLQTFGVCKAVIANRNGILVAGHQRTKAMKAVGIQNTPVFLLNKTVALHDEIKFNLMHNSIETETSKVVIEGAEQLPYGFSTVGFATIRVDQTGKGTIAKEICNLMTKYGDWGSVIIDEQGRVIHNSDYAFCCKLLSRELVVFKMNNDTAARFLTYMGIDYGSYNYETLGIKPYVQTYCQMNRGKSLGSTLYENYVLKHVKPGKRLVDFGAGKMHYVKKLQSEGYKAFGYEPHIRKQGSDTQLDIRAVVRDIQAIQADVRENGLYDIVVLDSVLNSITSVDFERWVVTTCNALMAKDGVFFTGTRNLFHIERQKNNSRSVDGGRYLEFLDKDNFSATFRKGVWTMQKFNTKESLYNLLRKYFEEVTVYDNNESQIWAMCRKPINLSPEAYKEALDIEFNMEYPGGYRHNKHEGLVAALMERLAER